ncbi:MAG: OmpH family outer membrane protein [Verrucomicrobiota bacterium]
MKKIALFVLVATLFSLPSIALSQMKVAVIDMQKVFKEYSMTKKADEELKSSFSDYQKTYKDMLEDYQKMVEEAGKLRDEANNEVLAEKVKEEKLKMYQAKVGEIRGYERKLKEFEITRRRQIEESGARMRKKIVEDITAQVEKISASKEFNIVMDKSGMAITGTPIVMYAAGLPDLTEEVITTVNAASAQQAN